MRQNNEFGEGPPPSPQLFSKTTSLYKNHLSQTGSSSQSNNTSCFNISLPTNSSSHIVPPIHIIDNELIKVRKKVHKRLMYDLDRINNSKLYLKYFIYVKLYNNHYTIKSLIDKLYSIIVHLHNRRQRNLYKDKTGICFPNDRYNGAMKYEHCLLAVKKVNLKMFKKRLLVEAEVPDHIIRSLLLVPKYMHLILRLKNEQIELTSLLRLHKTDLNELNQLFMKELGEQLIIKRRCVLNKLLGTITIRTKIFKQNRVISTIDTARSHKEILAAFKQIDETVTMQDLINEYELDPVYVTFPAIVWNYLAWNRPQNNLRNKHLRHRSFKQSKSLTSIYRQINPQLYEYQLCIS